MFRKAFKYDFRAMGKYLLAFPAVPALAAVAGALVRLIDRLDSLEWVGAELTLGVAVFLCAAAVGCFPLGILILCLRRYYNHFFSDEGYLTFTLPVRRETLLFSKTVSTLLVLALAAVIECVAGAVFLMITPDGIPFLRDALRELAEALADPRFLSVALLYFLTLPVTLLSGVATMHFSLTQGQALAKKHKILAAIGIWYGITFIERTATQGAGLIFLFSLFTADDAVSTDQGFFTLALYLSLLLLLRLGCFIVFYFWNEKLLKTRLSLA